MSASLIKHENEKFTSQTINLGGHAFFNCEFERCTVIYSNLPTIINGCKLNNCNWKIDFDLIVGDLQAVNSLKSILDLLQPGEQQEISFDAKLKDKLNS